MKTVIKILMIVDDGPIDQYIIERTVRENNFAHDIIKCMDGQAGLDYLTACGEDVLQLPQLILLDINMPNVNGYQFMKEFTGFPAKVRDFCRIAVISSSVMKEDIEHFSRFDEVLGFIEKPLTKQKLDRLFWEHFT